MTTDNYPFRFLSGNALKLIAAFFMVVDHTALLFFPSVVWLRYLGRIALPIFAFLLAEGARYTKNKVKHFALLFILAFLCQAVYIIAMDDWYMSILVTFSISLLLIYALQAVQKAIFDKKALPALLFCLLFGALVVGTWFLNKAFTIDYGFWGCMLPVFVSLVDFRALKGYEKWRFAEHLLRILLLVVGLLVLSATAGGYQWYTLLSLPFLLCYNGARGKKNMKYFFYIFYPSHLLILQGLFMLIYVL